jgi:hypothetical protein
MKKALLQLGIGAGLAVLAASPIMLAPAKAHADGFSANINIGDDDEAHFHFSDRGRVDPKIFAAADNLRQAKRKLWDARHDFGGHRDAAINAINHALDELRMAAEFSHHH